MSNHEFVPFIVAASLVAGISLQSIGSRIYKRAGARTHAYGASIVATGFLTASLGILGGLWGWF
jgi:hypothetical protein